MKKYSKLIIITTLITLLPILIGIFLWDQLPNTIAIHWNAGGKADGWSSKLFAVLALPCLLAVIQLIVAFVTLNDPKRKHIHKKPFLLILWLVPIMSLFTNSATYMNALGLKFNMGILVSSLVGILFVILGNYMPKLQQNYTIGIRVPWTLNSEENWNKTHRLGGKLWIAGGIFTILSGLSGAFLGDTFAFITLISVTLLCALIPAGYSFFLFRQGI